MIFGDNLTTEQKWESVRGIRNRMLAESDWTQLNDSTANKISWAEYRKSLRDIPQVFQSPELIVWPVKPE